MNETPLLDISGLAVTFHGDRGRKTHAVHTLDLSVNRGATLGIVGESGCGKSVAALSVMGLLPRNAEISGRINFNGRDLLNIPDDELRDLRGDRITMIFQEPMTSLNPSLTIGDQIAEVLVRHRDISPEQARDRSIELLRRVNIPSPEKRFNEYERATQPLFDWFDEQGIAVDDINAERSVEQVNDELVKLINEK